MIWILLLYVLPLVISVIGAYSMVKKDKGSIKDFLEPLPFLLIPIFNISVLIVLVYSLVEDWIKNDESIQNFLNKKIK
jgi:p-aminobenzoyl-glutamate transporter AbgT